MRTNELEKSKKQTLTEIIEYVPNSVATKTIMHRATGNVSVVAIDKGKALREKISPFDTFIQIIEGTAEVIVDKTTSILKTGESIIIPAHTCNNVKASGRLKIILTVIKSGYESVTL